MRIIDFHKLRAAVQANAGPAPEQERQVVADRVRAALVGSGIFEDVEVEHTDDADQLVIAMCRFSSPLTADVAEQWLEWLWQHEVRYGFWEAHGTLVEPDQVEFEGATRAATFGRYVTIHIVAQRVAVPAQRGAEETEPVDRPAEVAALTSSELDRALTLSVDDSGEFHADIDPGWVIGHAVNGGVQLALLGEALRRTLAADGCPDPLAMSAYYLSACAAGPARMVVDPVRSGRTMATAQASLFQPGPDGDDVERVRVLATYGDLGALPADVSTSAQPPDLPDVEECVSADTPAPGAPDLPFLHRFDMRLDPATVGWALGEPSRRGVIQGWLRMADHREPDPLMLLLAVDALPPVTFDMGLTGWAPTLELSVHVRALPAPGWLRVRVSTSNLAGGLFEEDAEVWDEAGRLVAQSRQLARIPR